MIERLVVSGRREVVTVDDLPVEVRAERDVTFRPRRERRRTIADQLYKKLVDERESFWTAVYPLYMQREITKSNVRDLVKRGLQETRGSYKIVVKLFNMDSNDYKKFLNFLRKRECPTGSRKSAATVNTSYPTFCISAMLSSSRSRCAFSIQRCS